MTSQVVELRAKLVSTNEVIDEVPLPLPPQTPRDQGRVVDDPADACSTGPAVTARDLPGAVHAAEHAAIGLLPLVATCDRWDVGGVSTPLHPDTGLCTIFIYDGYPGGAGIAERGFRTADRWLARDARGDPPVPVLAGVPVAACSRRSAATATSRSTSRARPSLLVGDPRGTMGMN